MCRKSPGCDGREQQHQIAPKPHHHHLCLGIAETRVIFDQFRAGLGQHQARKQYARKWHPLLRHDLDSRPDDVRHHARLQGRGENGCRAIGPHAPGIQPRIAFANAFVVLRAGKGDCRFAVGQCEKAHFLAGHIVFDDDRGARVAKAAAKHVVDRGARLVDGFGNDHALARRQAIGLDDDRQAKVA